MGKPHEHREKGIELIIDAMIDAHERSEIIQAVVKKFEGVNERTAYNWYDCALKRLA
jgi:hypothetical protein